MKIVEALGEPIEYGGEEMYIRNLVKQLGQEFQVDVLTPYTCSNRAIRELIESRGGRVIELGLEFKPGRGRWREASAIRECLRSIEADIIHAHSGSMSMLGIYADAARKAGVKQIIVHCHCAGHDTLKHRMARRLADRLIDKAGALKLACSRAAGVWSYDSMEDVIYAADGINCEEFRFNRDSRERTRKSWGLDNEILLGCVGRLAPEKNHRMALELMKYLPHQYRLVIAGDGVLKDELKELSSSLGIEDRVIWTGNVDNVADCYNAMDICLIPSVYEGLSLAAIEAQCNGLPVIASDGLPHEVVCTDGIVRIERRDFGRWLDAIRGCSLERLDNYEIVRTAWDVKVTCERIKNIYREFGNGENRRS